jgi:stearoyl-CoA desaturase (delta-9 desaturase)
MWFSHIGWMLRSYASGEPDFKYVKDLERDPIVMFQHRHYVALVLAMNIALPLLVGALSGDVWGTLMLAGVLRLVVNHHVTFFINSLAHGWGRQPYTDKNTSRDNPILAFFTYGQVITTSITCSRAITTTASLVAVDPTKWLINAMSMLGLASKKVTPSVAIEQARLDMQFNRAQVSVAKHSERGDGYAMELREFVAREYDASRGNACGMVRRRDTWICDARAGRRATRRDFTAYAREIEQRLRAQRVARGMFDRSDAERLTDPA